MTLVGVVRTEIEPTHRNKHNEKNKVSARAHQRVHDATKEKESDKAAQNTAKENNASSRVLMKLNLTLDPLPSM
jgi:hypothetical protein